MVKEFKPAYPYMKGVTTSEFRRRLAHYIGRVRHGNDFVAIRRKGEEPVFLVSKADFDLIQNEVIDLEKGKLKPKQGRSGGLWQLLNWEHRCQQIDEYLKSQGE